MKKTKRSKKTSSFFKKTGKNEAFPQDKKVKSYRNLSEGQKTKWISYKLNPLSSSSISSFAFLFEGEINKKNLIESLSIPIKRYEILRSYFRENRGNVERCVRSNITGQIDFKKTSQQKALQILQQEKNSSMDLTKGPLFRVQLIQVSRKRCFFLLRVHQIIWDGDSLEVFLREWGQVYNSLCRKRKILLPERKSQYQHFIADQIKKTEKQKIEENLRFWEKKLDGVSDLLVLPYDHQRLPIFREKGKEYDFHLPQIELQNFFQVSRDLNIDVQELFLASFFVFLYKILGQQDLCIGTSFIGNREKEWKDVVGPFSQDIVIRQRISGGVSFKTFLKEIHQTMKEAKKHADVSFLQLISQLHLQTNPSFHPIFQIFFSMEKEASKFLKLEGIKISPLTLEETVSALDFSLFLTEDGSGRIQYCSDLFEEDSIRRMANHFQCLLEGISKDPDAIINSISIMPKTEVEKILYQWNDNRTKYPRNSSVVEVFEQIAKKYPEKIALKYKNEEQTYRELNEMANRFARHLKKLGVCKQEFVGISMNKSIPLIVGILAILKLGGIYLPIDASYPEERRRFFIEDAKIKVLITQSDFLSLFSKETLEVVCWERMKDLFSDYESENLEIDIGPLDIAYVNYTSGSTGLPKGVEVLHRGILRLVKEPNWIEISPNDCFLQVSNISFDATTLEIWGALLNGGCLCIYPYKKLTTQEMGEFLEKEKVTQAVFSAQFFNLMINEQLPSLQGLRYLHSVGEAMSVAHTKKAFSALSQTRLVNGYGPTENTVYSCTYTINNLKNIEDGVPIGKPISNTSIYILNSNLQPIPVGSVGEIYTGGDGVARGYLNRKELTDEKFIKDPFSKEEGAMMYRTGDLGRFLPDGNIIFMGRVDNQVKIRGFRVETGEIEKTVKEIKNINDCVCVVCEESEGEKELAIYVRGSKEWTSEKLREVLSTKLPSYLIPNFIIVMEHFPTNPVGKIDRKALLHPRKFLEEGKEEYKPPETAIEQLIADIWSSLLKIKKISRQDNFFYIGGHSINAAELFSLLSQALQKEISPTLIFEEPILKNYAKKIEEVLSGVAEKKKKQILYSDLFWIWRNKEISLDEEIGKEKLLSPSERQYTHPHFVFLTGATGFVGAFVLQAILEKTKAKVYCHVRANTEEEGFQRIQAVMKKYKIWKKKYSNRIISVPGDLEKKYLGIRLKLFDELAERIDSIFHVGASVNHVLPFNKLKAANVSGTQEAIRLALKKKSKPFHFISTIDVFGMKEEVIPEETDLSSFRNLFNGYAQSKWIAEKIVHLAKKRGLSANIYRLSRTVGSSRTGSGPTSDFLWMLIQASIQLKIFPRINFEENMTSIDYVVDTLLCISKKPSFIGMEYHLFNPQSYSYEDVFQVLRDFGYQLKMADYDLWKQTLIKESIKKGGEKLRSITPLLCEINFSAMPQKMHFKFDNINKACKESAKRCPLMRKKLFELYFDYYIKTGFLPPTLT